MQNLLGDASHHLLGGGGQAAQALGRSRGGFGAKIHLKTDHDGLPIAFELTDGEASDSPLFADLIDAWPDEAPRAVVADKGSPSRACKHALPGSGQRCKPRHGRERGAVPVIPHRSNRKTIPVRFAKALYKGRARPFHRLQANDYRAAIKQMMGKLKRFKRVALRCEKTARNFQSIVALTATFILLKSVHNA